MFKTRKTQKELGYYSDWVGNQLMSLNYPMGIMTFKDDHPFKKYFIQSDAPVLENVKDVNYLGPRNGEVNIQVAIQQGFIYDISRIERNKNRPAIVMKLRDGRYRVMTANKNLVLTSEQMADYAIPVKINGKNMQTLDFENLQVSPSKLTVKSKFDVWGQPSVIDVYEGRIYLLIERQKDVIPGRRDPDYYSRILGAEIITGQQLRTKRAIDEYGNFDFEHHYLQHKDILTFLDVAGRFGYVGVGSMRYVFEGEEAQFENYSDFFKKTYQDNVKTPKDHFFTVLPGAARGGSLFGGGGGIEEMCDHLCIRI